MHLGRVGDTSAAGHKAAAADGLALTRTLDHASRVDTARILGRPA